MSLTVASALREARALGLSRLDAQLLLAHVLGVRRTWLIAHDDAPIDPLQRERFAAASVRLADGEPLAYVTGEREFHGLSLKVTPAVLVPRPDTETLVDWALERLGSRTPGEGPAAAPRVLDLGTGSGAIALALKHRHPAAQVTAVDRDPAALAVALRNAGRLGLDVEWLAGNWFEPVAGRSFDLVVSNPPYIADGDPHLAALQHEPRGALVAGHDGLADLARIAAAAGAHLLPGGWLMLEHGWEQGAAVQELLARHGFDQLETRHDLENRPRCTAGRRIATNTTLRGGQT